MADALAAELRLMAGWMGLADVAVVERGDLWPEVSRALGVPASPA